MKLSLATFFQVSKPLRSIHVFPRNAVFCKSLVLALYQFSKATYSDLNLGIANKAPSTSGITFPFRIAHTVVIQHGRSE